MERQDLKGIARFDLEEPCTIRTYQPGDERHWYSIHLEADKLSNITQELFASQFGSDQRVLSTRQLYLCDADSVVGTATAWYGDTYKDGSYGRVHWVAIRPSHQGRGLSKPLLSEVLQTLARLGYTKAYLTTSRLRPVAMHLYRSFGFIEA
jgi:GNAT superfamily N-acetyltransferase